MQHTLERIIGKPSDYKECTTCKQINWYENDSCIECGESLENISIMTDRQMLNFKEEELLALSEDYSEEEIYQIVLNV